MNHENQLIQIINDNEYPKFQKRATALLSEIYKLNEKSVKNKFKILDLIEDIEFEKREENENCFSPLTINKKKYYIYKKKY